MKALVFQGPEGTAWQDVPDPIIKDAAEAVVRVGAATVRGTDPHVTKGDVPEVTPGRIPGHGAVGTVVETGGDVRTVRPGDRVLISCIPRLRRVGTGAHRRQCPGRVRQGPLRRPLRPPRRPRGGARRAPARRRPGRGRAAVTPRGDGKP